MKYYLAPLEGITTWVYRKAHAEVYGPVDKYFIPFIEPHEKRSFKTRELQEILPEHNEGLYAVPQILTNRTEGFLRLCHALKEFGYEEVNLNLGCPSRTVVSKGKGSGFLAYPEELERFLDEIFSEADIKISIKTRIGKDNPEEFDRLLAIFNQYPAKELIIHPRVQADYYGGKPRMEAFRKACRESRIPLCYNGDLFGRSRIQDFQKEYPKADRIMIGRGVIINPGLFCGSGTKEQLERFNERLCQGYLERDMGEVNVLYKMKELWFYQIHLFPDSERYGKKIKKAQKLSEYRQIVAELLRERELCPLS